MIIELAPGLMIDTEKKPYSTEGFQIFVGGKTGSGKSYTLAVLLEQASDVGVQFVYMDPHGEGHTLSELGDHVVVISERVGIPIHIDAIPIYIDILKSGKSVVLDISDMYFNNKKTFAAFSESFVRQFRAEWSKVRDYILLVIDEVHVFAPQKPRKNEQERVDLFGLMASEGRKLGIMMTTATQRPALVSKTAISQANIRLVGKITKSHDFKAFEADIPREEYEVIVKGEPVIKTRPAITFKDVRDMDAGEFYAITNEGVKLVKIHERRTFDAGMTPEAKKQKPVLSKKQTLDSEEIGKRIKEAIEAAAQNIELERSQAEEIQRLQRQVEREKKGKEDAESQRDMVQFIGEKFGGSVVKTSKTGTKVSVPQDVVELKAEFDKTLDELRRRYTTMEQTKVDIISGLVEERDMLAGQVKDLLEEAKAYMDLGDALKRVVGHWDETTILIDKDLEDSIMERVRKEFSGMSGNQHNFTGDITEDLRLMWEQRSVDVQNTWEQRAMDKMKTIIDGLRHESLIIISWLISEDTARRRADVARRTGFTATSSGSIFDTAFKAVIKTGLTKSSGHGYSIDIDEFIKSHVEVPEYDAANLKHHLIRYIIEQEQSKKEKGNDK